VVFFKLHLVMFFERIHLERALIRVAADRRSVRWYLGYDLGEALPEHSTLTKIRTRYGLETFRRFFDAMVAQCQAAGLVWGAELYTDAPKVVANAAVDSVQPRFAVAAREHLDDLCGLDAGALGPQPAAVAAEDPVPPGRIGPTADEAPALAATNAARHDWIVAAGQQNRTPQEERRYPRSSDFIMSTTDPDATHLRQRDGVRLGYQDHYVVDGGKARIIRTALVASAEVPEDQPTLDLIWYARCRWHLWPRQATGDKASATLAVIRALEEQGGRAYLPLPAYDGRSGFFGKGAFRYDPLTDAYTCPAGATLAYVRPDRSAALYLYQAPAATCTACPLKERCTASTHGRMISRHDDEDYLDRVRADQDTPA
jgi:hypothetical protein